jgi:DNA polymerase III delta subunit
VSTYTQWRAAADRGEIKRITWVCGDQPALVEDVVATIRTNLRLEPTDLWTLTAGQDSDRDVWAAAHQYPGAVPTNRLIVVRQAQRFKIWRPLAGWLDAYRALKGIYLIFVSDEADFTTAGRTGELVAHLQVIRDRGRIVRCAAPNHDDCLKWIKAQSNLTDEAAEHLIDRAGGDVQIIGNLLRKLELFENTASSGAIDALVDREPADTFSELLLANDKRGALIAGSRVSEKDIIGIVSAADRRLDVLEKLWTASHAGLAVRDIRGINPYLIRKYSNLARTYDPARVAKIRRLLAVCDRALRSGVSDGVIEALIAMW